MKKYSLKKIKEVSHDRTGMGHLYLKQRRIGQTS